LTPLLAHVIFTLVLIIFLLGHALFFTKFALFLGGDAVLTITELNEIRARVRQHLSVRKDDNEARVIIASGTTAIAAGSRQLMAAALEEISAHNANVQVSQRELDVEAGEQPAVIVATNGSEVLYKRCTAAELRAIIRRFAATKAANAD
jgi:hypothetical protein